MPTAEDLRSELPESTVGRITQTRTLEERVKLSRHIGEIGDYLKCEVTIVKAFPVRSRSQGACMGYLAVTSDGFWFKWFTPKLLFDWRAGTKLFIHGSSGKGCKVKKHHIDPGKGTLINVLTDMDDRHATVVVKSNGRKAA